MLFCLYFLVIYSRTLTSVSFLHLVYFKSTSFNHDHQDSCSFCCLIQIYQPYRGVNNNIPNLQARLAAPIHTFLSLMFFEERSAIVHRLQLSGKVSKRFSTNSPPHPRWVSLFWRMKDSGSRSRI